MQTNLTLATDGIVSVLEELLTDSGLGTSLEPFQDYRKLKDGASYMERWYEGFEHVKSRGFRVGMVYVVHGRSIDRVRDLYYYFKNLGLDSLTVIPLEKPAGAFRGEGLDPPAWGRFLVELFKVWRADGRSFPVQPFYGWEEMLDVSSSPSCDQLVSCSEPMMAVSPNGDIYPCVRRADMRVGKVGNILSDSIEQLLSHPDSKWRSLRRELITEGSCGTCKWWRFCAGGCAAASGYRQKTKWCQGYRIFFEAFDER
jgi:radical SAM protein with 4Fe4S-binding SPASM domain